jgi:hypothetical protein
MADQMTSEVFFQDKGATYKVLTLRQLPQELFLHLSYSNKHRKRKILNSEKVTRRPDHFSWHADGRGHLKISSEQKFQKGKFSDGIFIPSGKAAFSPLFIVSHIKGEETWEAEPTQDSPAPLYLLKIEPLERFSIVGFLVPKNMPLVAFQYLYACFTPEHAAPLAIPLSNLFFPPSDHIRVVLHPDYDILICISDLINLDRPSLEQLRRQFAGDGFFSSTFVDIDKALSKMLYQRILANS